MPLLDGILTARLVCTNLPGAVAQLGERMTGSHEVRGSIPLGSTNNINSLGPLPARPFAILCAYSVPTNQDGDSFTRTGFVLACPMPLAAWKVKHESRYQVSVLCLRDRDVRSRPSDVHLQQAKESRMYGEGHTGGNSRRGWHVSEAA